MKKYILSTILLCSSLFATVPSYSGISLKKITGDTSFTNIESGEAIQITFNNVDEGGKTDTKRKVFASLSGIKGQGIFGLMSKDTFVWQAPKVPGTYTIGAYVENTDGTSNISSTDIIVNNSSVSNVGRNNCPINFIFVPNSQGLHGEAKGWCIMKYEASPYSSYSGVLENGNNTVSFNLSKSGGEYATSKPKNPIYYNGSLDNAKERCSSIKDSNGTSYSNGTVISIDVWSSLVKDLYHTNYNWTEGAETGGNLFVGHTDMDPAYPLQPSNLDTDGYYSTINNSSESSLIGISQRRTMKTSFGDFIWDIVGNTREFFRENYSLSTSVSSTVSFVILPTTYSFTAVTQVVEEQTNYVYSNPINLDNYLKLAPLNILGFKPYNIADKYLRFNAGTNQTPVYSYDSYINLYTSKTSLYQNIRYWLVAQTMATPATYLFSAASYFGTSHKYAEFGFGVENGYGNGTLSYGTNTGVSILYGGGFSANTNPTKVFGQPQSLFNNSGLFQSTIYTDENIGTVITSNTTAVNAGFRCMIPAN